MRVLAVDTSTMMSSIAILEDDVIIGDFSVNIKESHSEMLVSLIKRLLEDLKFTLKDIDLFAIAKGPGSFTGLRIGMTSLKAMAQALDKPIVGVSTLEAMAFSIVGQEAYILPLIDARGTRYFAGLYHWEDKQLVKDFEGLIEEEDLYRNLKKIQGPIIALGEGKRKMGEEIKTLDNLTLSHPALDNGIAKNVAVLALDKYKAGYVDSTFDIEPSYLRKSQAEINFEKKNL